MICIYSSLFIRTIANVLLKLRHFFHWTANMQWALVGASVVRYPRYLDTYRRYLCDDTSIAKVTIYRSSKIYRETVQVLWVSRYRTGCTTRQRMHIASMRYRNELNSHGKAMSALAAVTKYTVLYFFAISGVCTALAYWTGHLQQSVLISRCVTEFLLRDAVCTVRYCHGIGLKVVRTSVHGLSVTLRYCDHI